MKRLLLVGIISALSALTMGALLDNPPTWNSGPETVTAVWDFSLIENIPIDAWSVNIPTTCLEGPGSFFTTLFGGYWDGTAKELSSSIWYSVELPDAPGDYVTTRVQLFLADGSESPAWAEFQHQAYLSGEVDDGNCAWSNDTHGDPEIVIVDGVAIFQRTVPRYDFMDCGEIAATGGFIQGGTFDASGDRRYTGMIVDVIVHDTEDPPSGGSRTSNCFIPDNDPPTPDPPVWASAPGAVSDHAISMTVSEATDDSGVEYLFDCFSGGGNDSEWQNSRTYVDTGLNPNTHYCYRVMARDKSIDRHETGWSTIACATTHTEDLTFPTPNPMTWAAVPTALSSNEISMTASPASDTSGVEYYFEETSGNPGGTNSGWRDNPSYTDTGLIPDTEYTYTVKARDKSSNQNTTAESTVESATTEAIPEIINNPPNWGNIGTVTAIWDFETQPLMDLETQTNPPTCIDPDTSGSYMMPIIDPSWSYGVLSGSLWYSVEVPAGGNYLTLRVQCHLSGDAPEAWEPQYSSAVPVSVDGFRCNDFWIDSVPEPVDDVLILQHTVAKNSGGCGEIMSAGGYIDYGQYRGIIVDIIVHDTENPPSWWSRTSTCFTPDEDPPTPDPATWDSGPAAEGPWSITMTATPGDDQTRIEYYFEETSGNEGGASSGWQRSNTYTDQFLTPETEYTYRVRMKDTSGNMTAWPESRSTTTDEMPSRDCPEGDLDDDCDCDFEDMLIFVGQWLDPPGCLDHIGDCADIVDPEGVNVADFSVLAADWMDAGEPIILVINELMASNSAVIADEHGEYDDWIEIYNAGTSPVLLSGMYLEDDGGNRWQVPPNVGINPGEFLLFWADDGWPDEGLLHTNFKLSKGGDGVTLYDTDGTTILDTISYSSMESNRSYGRYPNATGNWYDMADTTPAATNARGLSGEVNFSHSAGIITSHFSLSLTTASPEAVIRYTTDGSEPTETTGQIYSGPISITNTAIIRAVAIDPGHAPGPVKTKTYLSLTDIYNQPALPAGFPDVWHEGDEEHPDNYPVNYQMYPDVITEYAAELGDAFTSIPSLSIVMNMDDLFSQETGIYPNSEERGVEWERPASAELLFGDGSEGFGINCGIRVYGAGSAMPWVNLKHSFRLLFKGDYGPTKLDFPFFDDSPVDEFDTIILRGGSNHCWASREEEYQRDDAEYIRDIFARDTQRAMGEFSSHGNFVHLFLNGVYWGLYNPSERPDAAFLSSYYGGEKEDWDAMNSLSEDMADGNREAWNTMMMIAEDGLQTQEAYEEIQEYLDVENLVTYMILNHYIGNLDWGEKNWYAGRLREPGAGFKIFSWDAELSMFDPDDQGNALIFYNLDHNHEDTPQRLFHQLRGNEEFRMLYADHLHRHLFNGGALTPNACIDRYSQRVDQLSTAIIGESARWGDQQMDTHEGLEGLPYTRDDDWIPQINWLRNDYMPFRSDVLLDQYRDYNLYPEVEAPVFYINGSYQHGGYLSAGASLTMTKSGGGTIYYTTDGSDPRLQGGAVSGSASTTLPYTVNSTKHIKARVKDGSNWSALNEAVFVAGDLNNLRITEIMYHPKETGNPADPNSEFIELKNVGGTAVNLNLVSFTNGIDYTFGDLTLGAGQYIVLVKDPAVFDAKYHPAFVGTRVGPYQGRLNNGGERITLSDGLGTEIMSFGFKDGWYRITDGEDFSLDLVNPSDTDPNLGEYIDHWRPSSVPKGTPGTADSGHVAQPGDIVINEVLSHSDGNPYNFDWIELHNTTGSSIDISGWFLSDDAKTLNKYVIQPGTSIPANGYRVFRQDTQFGKYSAPGVNTAFGLSEHGEAIYLSSANGIFLTGGFCTKEDFGASEPDVTIGRYTKSAASGYDVDFVSMDSPTYGTPNSAASVAPVVISEIMYHPNAANLQNNYAEYVELYNASGSEVPLYDPANPENTWLFTDEDGEISFSFPPSVSIAAGGRILLVKSLAAFTAEFGTPSVPAYQWLEGRLSNAGEKIELLKPGKPEVDGFVAYYRADRVNYSDGFHDENFRELGYDDPWPTSPDGGGDALHRSSMTSYGNDVGNWTAGAPTPGS